MLLPVHFFEMKSLQVASFRRCKYAALFKHMRLRISQDIWYPTWTTFGPKWRLSGRFRQGFTVHSQLQSGSMIPANPIGWANVNTMILLTAKVHVGARPWIGFGSRILSSLGAGLFISPKSVNKESNLGRASGTFAVSPTWVTCGPHRVRFLVATAT